MEYRVAVVIQPKNTTDLAGTIVFGEHIKDLGTVLCMVTPEHDVIPFADNDQPKIDRMIKNILTEGDFPTLSDEQYMKNSTNLPPFELSGDPSIMIVKKGGESFVHNDIEKYVETLNKVSEDVEPYVMHTKYENVDRINMPYLTDEVVFWRYKENIYNENKYHSLETQIRYLLDVVCKEYADDTDRFINIVNKFYACGCDPKILNWHKLNLSQINRDDKLIRLFGELSDKRHNIENIEDTLNGLKDDITEGCYIQRMRLDRGGDRFVNIKIYSNFKFPRIRGIVLGYDGSNICAARFDATSKNGIPLYVAVDTWVGNGDNPPIIIAPSDSSYTMTVDTRAQFFLITDIPECVYEVLDQMRFTMEEAMATPLSTQFNGDFIKNAKDTLLYNIGENTVVAQKLSIVGTLEEDLRESYMTSYRVSHRLPQLIDDIDDEEMFIIGDMEDINYEQLINFRVYDNSNNGNTILDKTITYKEYLAMAGGFPFRYPTVYDDGIDYTVETTFVKRDGHQIPNTITYTVHTRVPRSGNAGVVTPDLETNREQVHLVKADGTMFEYGTVVKAIVLNGNGSKVYDGTVKVTSNDIDNGYVNLPCINSLSGTITINLRIKEPNKFQSNNQTINIDMSKILPAANYDITAMELWKDGNMYINKNTILRQLIQTAGITGGAWYTDIDRYYSEYPVSFGLKYNCGAPKVEITTRIIGVPNMADLSWTKTIERSLNEINVNGIISNRTTILDNEFNTLPYNYHYDRYLRFNHYDTDGINSFTHNNPDVIVPYGGSYEFTIKSFDAFGSVRKTVTYNVPSIFDEKLTHTSIIEDDIWNDFFETVATEDNMISNLKLNVGTKYAHMECILMMELEDNIPNENTKLFSFYVNEHGMVTSNPTTNYDPLNRQLDKYILYDASDLENILSRQNFTLWIRPKNDTNPLFADWYRGRVNNTFQRLDKVITRAVPKEIGINKLVSRVYMPPYINYIDDELLEIAFTTNVPNNKKNDFEITVDVINVDDNETLTTSTATVAEWELLNNRIAYDKLKFPRTVNNYKVVATMKNKTDATWTSANVKKEDTVTVERTEQPWFSNAHLDVIPLVNLDIRQNPGASFPLGTTFWVRIENDDGDMLFEYNGKIDAGDIYDGYHRVYVPNKPEGVFTLSVIAREPNKYQSLIFRSSAEFVDNIRYAKVLYDDSKDLSLVKYELNQGLSEESIAYIEKLIRRNHPTRKVSKVTTVTKGENPVSTDYASLSDLKTVSLPADITIKIELAEKVAGDYPYIDVFFDGATASNIPLDEHGKVLNEALVNWRNDYKWQWDLDIFNRGFDVEEKDADGHVLSNTHYNSLNELKTATFSNTNYKSIKLTGVQNRPATKDLYFKSKDKTMVDFDIQVKRSPEYNETTSQYKYKITNTRERNENDLRNMANAIARLVRISNSDYVLNTLESPNGDVIWTYGSGVSSNFDRWKDGEFDNGNLMISVRQDNVITLNMAFKFPQYPELNFTSTKVLHSTRIGDVVKYSKIRGLTDRYMRMFDQNERGLSDDTHYIVKLQNNNGDWDIIHDYNAIYRAGELDFLHISRYDNDPYGNEDHIYAGYAIWTEFTVDREVYNFEVTTKFINLRLIENKFRNHTIFQFNIDGATIDKNSTAFSDKSKVYVYDDNGVIPLTSSTKPSNRFYVYVPNNGILNQMVDISKFNKDAGKTLDKYDLHVDRMYGIGYSNHINSPWNGPRFSSPIPYRSGYDSVDYINITFKDDIILQPKIVSMVTTRQFDGDVVMYRDENNEMALCYPMQTIDSTTDDPNALMFKIATYILTHYRYNVEYLIYGDDASKYNTSDITPYNLFVYLEYPTLIPKDIKATTVIKLDSPCDTNWNTKHTITNFDAVLSGGYSATTDFIATTISNKYEADVGGMLQTLSLRNRTKPDILGVITSEKEITVSSDKKTLTIESTLFAKGEMRTEFPEWSIITKLDKHINYGDYVIAYNMYRQTGIKLTEAYKTDIKAPRGSSDMNHIMYKSVKMKMADDPESYISGRDNATDLASIFALASDMRRSVGTMDYRTHMQPVNTLLSLSYKYIKHGDSVLKEFDHYDHTGLITLTSGVGDIHIYAPSLRKGSGSVSKYEFQLTTNEQFTSTGDCYDAINTLNQLVTINVNGTDDTGYDGIIGAYYTSKTIWKGNLDDKNDNGVYSINAYASNIISEPLIYTHSRNEVDHIPNCIVYNNDVMKNDKTYNLIQDRYSWVLNGNSMANYIGARNFRMFPIGFWCNYQVPDTNGVTSIEVDNKRLDMIMSSVNDTIVFPINYKHKIHNDNIITSLRNTNNALIRDQDMLPDLYTTTELLVSYKNDLTSSDIYTIITPPSHAVKTDYINEMPELARPNILYDVNPRTFMNTTAGGVIVSETYINKDDKYAYKVIDTIRYRLGAGLVRIKISPMPVNTVVLDVIKPKLISPNVGISMIVDNAKKDGSAFDVSFEQITGAKYINAANGKLPVDNIGLWTIQEWQLWALKNNFSQDPNTYTNIYRTDVAFEYSGMMHAILSRSWDKSTYYIDNKYMCINVDIEYVQDKLKTKGSCNYQIILDMTTAQPNLNETRNAEGTWNRDVNFDPIPDNANWFSPNYAFYDYYRMRDKLPTPYKDFTVKRIPRNVKLKIMNNAVDSMWLVADRELKENAVVTYNGDTKSPMINFFDNKVDGSHRIVYFDKESNPQAAMTVRNGIECSATYVNVNNDSIYERYFKGCSDVYARLNITLQNKHRHNSYITESTLYTPIVIDQFDNVPNRANRGIRNTLVHYVGDRLVRSYNITQNVFVELYNKIYNKRTFYGTSIQGSPIWPFWLNTNRLILSNARKMMTMYLMYTIYTGSFKGFSLDDFADFFKYLHSASAPKDGFKSNPTARKRYSDIFEQWIPFVVEYLDESIYPGRDAFMEVHGELLDYHKYIYENLLFLNNEQFAESIGRSVYNTYMKTVNKKDAGPAQKVLEDMLNEYRSGPSNRSTRYDNTPDDGVDIVEEWMDDINNDDRVHNDPYATKTIALQPDIFNQQDPTSSRLTVLAKTRIGNTMHILVEAVSLHYIYRCIDYVQPSLVTIIQPAKNFLDNYKTVISIELPKDSTGYIGTWQDGYDLSYPTTITINDMDTISNNEFLEMANRDDVVPNVIIGFYKPGVDPDFTTYVKKSKKSGLYLKVDTTLTENKAGDRSSKSEEFYYPLFNTIGRNVERKLDLLYNNKVYFARTSGAREIILQNGASFFPNPLLDYVLSILDNSSDSKILRLY